MLISEVPHASADASRATCAEIVDSFRLLLLKAGPGSNEARPGPAGLSLLRQAALKHSKAVRAAWTAETPGADPTVLFDRSAPIDGPWYASFVLEGSVAEDLVATCSLASLTPAIFKDWSSSGAAWAFFGSNGDDNMAAAMLTGKSEHVDQLRPGAITVHSQLCGEKIWRLRPYVDSGCWTGRSAPATATPDGRLEVRCRAGDQLIIDTGAWFHETRIPPATDFSLSIAQDFVEPNLFQLGPRISSSQMQISQQICSLCMTPTAPAAGMPPGTCGCACCSAKRFERSSWDLLRRNALLSRQLTPLWHVQRLLLQNFRPKLLAICDARETVTSLSQ